ncbi:MAG TPA: S9 family peptidase [Bryobacteraceae bacterium]|jgi:dipeptidyl aminopeptidase/acylaminoacyl peptidase
MLFSRLSILSSALTLCATTATAAGSGLQSQDLYHFRSVSDVEISPDGRHIAYAVTMNDRPGRPYAQIWIMDAVTQKTARIGSEKETTSHPRWSPDGKLIAFLGGSEEKTGLMYAQADGSGETFLTATSSTNSPLPGQGETFSWSPDSKSIAYVSATPGPEAQEASGDPIVITRYLYKPTAGEGLTHFSDNKRLHLFSIDISTKQQRQLTTGNYDEHSVDWSPDGQEILFVSNREPNSDEFFNYDVFAMKLSDGSIRRITATESCEYAPVWSPDGKSIAFLGTRRGLTDRETTMEDTHVWVMDTNGAHRRNIGASLDNRQQEFRWAADGGSVYVAYQERGNVHLARLLVSGGAPQVIVSETGSMGSFSVDKQGKIAYSFATPQDLSQLYVTDGHSAGRQLTSLNSDLLAGNQIVEVEPFTFISNDNKFEVEAYLTKPVGLNTENKYPLIVNIHGGPHGQNGSAFNFKNQVYAAKGWAVLQVNYRGSTGYGQKFADAVFGDQDGNEGQDVLYGVSAAIRRYLWIDRERMGIEGVSYGGQLSDWLITQTNEFKAAIPTAGIANLISYNYMTYYNQYEEMEFGQFLHQGNLMEDAWERSALKHVASVHTPTLLVHGENDSDVPIAEAEQYFVALKDVGVDTVFVRYPREGHGIRETKHVVDWIDRSIAWYEKHFPKPGAEAITNTQP